MDFSSSDPRNPQRFPLKEKCSKPSDARDIDVFKMSLLSEVHSYFYRRRFLHIARSLLGIRDQRKNSGIFSFQSGF
ncbi:hypothetical protein CEXT_151611 [Caerostris extrusa]|uniref:Uncharacterized protein n=1 Tax=Caerostris extrusa TaxID=172846 RepID=A0AAV4XCT7_CAEEX|nr:hypothetical protein CEXT_151611 [Caerostris extrusa]